MHKITTYFFLSQGSHKIGTKSAEIGFDPSELRKKDIMTPDMTCMKSIVKQYYES